jgi:hypothetical protein
VLVVVRLQFRDEQLAEGVPVYTIFTNEQLAQMLQRGWD